MKRVSYILTIFTVILVLVLTACAGPQQVAPSSSESAAEEAGESSAAEEPAQAEEGAKLAELPAAPAFDSMCQPEDEGLVQPVDIQPDEPLRIAVLGLENNPFWIPVKEGTLAAADELAAYNTTVDWIVPGESHTADFFSGGIEAARNAAGHSIRN